MGEKRKSSFKILLKSASKKKWNKLELFHSLEFGYYSTRVDKYRIRANGAWYPKGEKNKYFSKK
jgi:hypothetical protein